MQAVCHLIGRDTSDFAFGELCSTRASHFASIAVCSHQLGGRGGWLPYCEQQVPYLGQSGKPWTDLIAVLDIQQSYRSPRMTPRYTCSSIKVMYDSSTSGGMGKVNG